MPEDYISDEELERERRRAELQEQISALREILNKLVSAKEELEKQKQKLDEEIIEVSSTYDLSVGETWVGKTELTAGELCKALEDALGVYSGDIEEIINKIVEVIDEISEEISELQEQLNAI